MKKENSVSIIMPAYNSSKYIDESINSVINQTYTNWELIIVNDNSTDDTGKIAEKYAALDDRIKIISFKDNRGSAKARNAAIKSSKGRYIAFLDSDDIWKKDKLEKQLTFMVSNDYAFTYTAYETFNDFNNKRKVFKVPDKVDYKKFLGNTCIGNLTVIIDKEKIKDFKVREGCLEDTLTWMQYLREGNVAYGLNESLACYRVHLYSKSYNKLKNAKKQWRCYREYEKLPFINSCIKEASYGINALVKRIF